MGAGLVGAHGVRPSGRASCAPTRPGSTALARLAEGLALGLVLAVALLPRLWNLDAYTGSFDEGIRSQQLLLMSAGFRPFREIFASQGPLLLDILYPFYRLFGETLEAARVGVVACSMVGLVGAWWVGRLAAGPFAGLASAVLLGLSPTYLEGSRLALAEVPTIAPALLAIGAALAYRCSGRLGWLYASAALCALALLIKPMVLHLGAPLLAIMVTPAWPAQMESGAWVGAVREPPLQPSTRTRGAAVNLLHYGAIVLGLCALIVGVLGPAQVWENLGAYRAAVGGRPGSEWAGNLRLVGNVLSQERVGLFALAVVGALLGLWRRPTQTVAIVFWAAAILAMFSLYGDLADKHVVYLVPPLALLGGIGIGVTAALVSGVAVRTVGAVREPPLNASEQKLQHDKRGGAHAATTRGTHLKGTARFSAERANPFSDPLIATIGVTALALYLWTVPAIYRANRYLIVEAEAVAERRRDLPAELDMAEVMRTAAGPTDWVLSDNPSAAFRARRLVIPSLVDTSGTRVDAGSLTDAQAIDAVERYRPAVIVTWARRLGRLDALTRWLPEHGYRLDRTYDNGWKLYLRSGQ